MQFDWDREELEKNWKREPLNLRQRIADKCRNLNKTEKRLKTLLIQWLTGKRAIFNLFEYLMSM